MKQQTREHKKNKQGHMRNETEKQHTTMENGTNKTKQRKPKMQKQTK